MEIKIIVKAKTNEIESIKQLLKLSVPNKFGKAIPLNTLVKVKEGVGYKIIKHKDTKNAITVVGSIDKSNADVAAVNVEVLKRIEKIQKEHPDVTIQASGEFKEMMENFKQLGFAF